MPSFSPVASVVRSFHVLALVNKLGEATVSDLHDATKLHKSTIVRMLETLIHMGYVTRLEHDVRYVPTGRCLLLSAGFRVIKDLARIAEPHLSTFRRHTGWPADIAVFDRNAMVVATTNRDAGGMSITRTHGSRVPLLVTSLGRAYLGHCSAQKIEIILGRLAQSTNREDSAAKNPLKVNRMLSEVRKRGYALPDAAYIQENYQGKITGFSVPVFAGGEVVAAINVMVHASVLTTNQATQKLLASLNATAKQVTIALEGEFGDAARIFAEEN